MKNVCVVGGGNLGHVVAGYLSACGKANITILTSKPEVWSHNLAVHIPQNQTLAGYVDIISDNAADVIPQAHIILFCLPGFAIKNKLEQIKPYLHSGQFVGSVFCSTGFFFEALDLLPSDVTLFGFQRVPFIARVTECGKSADLKGFKESHNIAVENCSIEEKESFRNLISDMFDAPVTLLSNYYEASFTNSNPILHTSRLYSMFKDWIPGTEYPRNYLFYQEWNIESAQCLIDMDMELFDILDRLPVKKGFLKTILDYYESSDAPSLAHKLSSIEGFKGIYSPMVQTSSGGFVPDFGSRYFTEDFPYGLHYIWKQAHELNIKVPTIDKVYNWGMSKLNY